MSRSIREPEFAAYVAITAAALIPIWSASIFPSQDGGAHLYNAHILAAIATGDAGHYTDIYAVNFSALANWVDHLALALLTLLVSPPTAEKLLLSLYVVTFAAAARYAAESMRPGAGWVAHLALPLIFTFSVQMAFYNFILSFPLYFVLIGYYWRHRNGGPTVAIAALLLAIYVLHPLTWLFSVLSLSIIVLATARREYVHGHTTIRLAARRLLQVWLAAVPGVILLLVLVGNEPAETTEWQPIPALLRHLYFGGPLWAYGPADTAFGAALFGVFVFATVLAWRSRATDGDGNAVAWAAAAYIALLLVLPSQWKSLGLITERVGTFAFFTWTLALARGVYGRRMRTTITIAAQVLALVLIARWTVAVDSLEAYVEEYVSIAPYVDESSRVLELNFAPRGRDPEGDRLSHPVAPFAHTAGMIGASRDAVILNDYEALTAVFPLKHRFEAADVLRSSLHDPPDVGLDDLDRFERATCQPIDFVVVWQANRDDQHTRSLLRELKDRYELTYVSRPNGYAQVLERREAADPCG